MSETRRAVFSWEEPGIALHDERVNPYGGLAPLGLVLEPGWRIDPEWVREQHGRVDVRDEGHVWGEIYSVGPIPFYAKTVDARIRRVFVLLSKPLRSE